MKAFLLQPWPWYTSGIMIALVMVLLLFFGKSFGFSSNLRIICAACGGGKYVKFFDYDWRSQTWNLLFVVGAVLGGFLSAEFLSTGEAVQVAQATIQDLREIGISAPKGLQPEEVFGLGWALTGACPGPMFVNLGYSYWAILVAIVGAIAGTYLYGAIKDRLPH